MHDPTAFERFLLNLSACLAALSAGEVDGALDHVLRDIGEALGTDRVTLLEFSAESAEVAATHAWARPGFETTALGALPSAEMPWSHAAIVRGEVVALAHAVDDLPVEAAREREFVLAAGLRSHLTVPVALGGHLICALSTSTFRHYCAWEDRLIDRFRLVGQILAHALVRSRAPVRIPETRLRRLDAVERDYIRLVIDRCGGRINGRGHAAETLGLHPNTLRSRMKKLGVLRRGRRV